MKALLFLEKALPLFFWALIMFSFDDAWCAALTLFAAVIHELGHLIFALAFTEKKAGAPIPNIFGFRINIGNLSYREELLVSLGGPLVNLLFGIPLLLLSAKGEFSLYLQTFGVINTVTAVSNLFVIESFDGYRILSSLFGIFGRVGARFFIVLDTVSLAFSATLTFLALYYVLKVGSGYWIFVVFFSLLISGIVKKQRTTIWEN